MISFAGDFAVLISSGLSLPQAFCLNLLSSLTAFIGGIVGILLGVNWNASPWIFAFTGGLFVYISLVDMVCTSFRHYILYLNLLVKVEISKEIWKKV